MTTSPGVFAIPCRHVADIELPRQVKRLYDLAYNFWWSWTPKAHELLSSIDPRAWAIYRNPVQLLINFERSHWQALLEDENFLENYTGVIRAFDAYLSERQKTWFGQQYPHYAGGPIAYFAMEYGVHQSLALYSGGLGVLGGDHLKGASDLGVPLIGVGLLYGHGYFLQNLDADGRQQHIFPEYDFSRLPVRPAASHTGTEVLVAVPFPGREVFAQVWVAQVGRVPLILLDTDIPQNDPADRPITSILYTPGREMRLAQEIVLGIGGVEALRALDIEPAVWHLNEGHSAFLQLERMREWVEEEKLPLAEAQPLLRRGTVFTTHTPVAAGNEQFDAALVRKYFQDCCELVEMPVEKLLAMGQADHGEPNQPFNLTALALRTASFVNGVSALNAEVSRRMWKHILPPGTAPDTAIRAITNGVHTPSWMGREIHELAVRWLGQDWQRQLLTPEGQAKIATIPDEELWAAHQAQKARLGRFMRSRLREQFVRHGASPDDLRQVQAFFDVQALTIGFARRFATYKRAYLLFSDLERLRALVTARERPLQILLAGKAHPADRAGQELIQRVFELGKSDPLRGRLFFMEDYDLRVARMMVQGVDVWLNTPRRPLEASGTSGMKAAINGAINCSVADGWWPEGYNGKNGWVIGDSREGADEAQQDREDAESLYRLLEQQIVPTYYDRDEASLPRGWLAVMKESMASILPRFSSDRMVREYCELAYMPLATAALDPQEVEVTELPVTVPPAGSS